jgi:ATP-binding cassette subfamily B protein
VLLISHRYNTVRGADHIYVLDRGRIIEHGNHEQLMSAAGVYCELFSLQAAAYTGAVGRDNPSDAAAAQLDGRTDTTDPLYGAQSSVRS